jgi:uncharacterized protein YbgA (DUF1722 family)/uncharacterized protein YbbK (DUF523 family)
MMEKIRLGISTCLLGERVRYDGGHKLDRFLRDTLGRYVEYLPVCPEAEAGLGIPREAMHLEGDPARPRLITTRSGRDLTGVMETWSHRRVTELEREGLCGFVFKSGSPSSGMERVRVKGPSGIPEKKGSGVFARIFMERFPQLPVEEEGRLSDPDLRENFIERIFVLKRWREMSGPDLRPGDLVRFHTVHKLLIMSHSVSHYRELGKLVARGGLLAGRELAQEYLPLLMQALKMKATPAKHANVLTHMMGYFKKQLAPDEKRELLELIENYRLGLLPLIVPVTLLKHYVRKYQEPYLENQVYLQPHPLELQLRNHA